MSPAEYSVSGLSSAALTFFRSSRFTTWASTRNGLVNPRLGRRRYIGIWPPSKPGLVPPPVRALWPLWPLPEVLPRPEPGPRPTRLRAGEEPGAGRSEESEMRSAMGLDLNEMPDLVQHPPHRGVVGELHRLLVVPKAERLQRAPHGLGVADGRADLGDLDRLSLRLRRDRRRVVPGALPPDDRIPSHRSALLPRLVGDLVDLDAALPRHLAGRYQPAQPVHRGPDHIVRVGGAQTLGQDVGNAGALQHRAHRPAGDDAGSGGRRLQQHPAGTMLTHDLVRDGGAGLGQLDHRSLGGVHRLADGLGDLVGLARGDPDLGLAVAHRHEGVEREPPAALDHLGHAVDGDDVLHVIAGVLPVAVAPTAAAAALAPAAPAAPASGLVGAGGAFGYRRPVRRVAGLWGRAFAARAGVNAGAAADILVRH